MEEGREAGREAIIDAVLALFDTGFYQPTPEDIAQRAGISVDTLFQHFDDVADLTRAAIDRTLATVITLVDPGVAPTAPTAEKIAGFAAARIRLWNAAAPVARASRALSHRNKAVASQLDDTRSFLRGQIGRLFAAELEDRPDALPAIDVLCSFEAFDLLCQGEGLSLAKAEEALVYALTKLLDP